VYEQIGNFNVVFENTKKKSTKKNTWKKVSIFLSFEDVNKVGYRDEPFIICIANETNTLSHLIHVMRNDRVTMMTLHMHEISSFSSRTLLVIVDNEVDDMHTIQNYHYKRISENIAYK